MVLAVSVAACIDPLRAYRTLWRRGPARAAGTGVFGIPEPPAV